MSASQTNLTGLSSRNRSLDVLRSIAILSVLLLHSTEAVLEMPASWVSIFAYGWIGVDLFFVLSGFLIGLQVFSGPEEGSRNEKLKVFWIKRWFRTFPLYYALLFVYVVIKPALGFSFNDWNPSFFFFLQNYFEPKDFVQTWSLCIEEQFYVIFPILAFSLGLQKKNRLIWLLPLLISITARWWLWDQGYLDGIGKKHSAFLVDFRTHTHLDGISVGVFLASTFSVWRNFSKFQKIFLGISSSTLVGLTIDSISPSMLEKDAVYAYTFFAVGFGGILVSTLSLNIPDFLYRPSLKIAEWSYGAYLWNNLFMRLMHKISIPLPWALKVGLFIFLSLGSAWITFLVIEKPFLKLRNHLLQKISA